MILRAFLFDLDGTLYDSGGILGEAYQEGLEGFLPVPTEAEVMRFVGRPVREIFAGLYPDVSESRRDEAADRVLASLLAKIRAGGGRLLPGAREVLTELRTRGIPRGIVTNARRSYLEAVLAANDIAGLVEPALCEGDRPGAGKGGLAVEILHAWGISPVEAGFVGDRASDREAAREAGMRFFGVVGHGPSEELAGADLVIRDLRELLPLTSPFPGR